MKRKERTEQEADGIGNPLHVVEPQYVEGEQEGILLSRDNRENNNVLLLAAIPYSNPAKPDSVQYPPEG